MIEARKFIRHPVDIPIEVASNDADDSASKTAAHSHDLSLGGLAFQLDRKLPAGIIVMIRIPFVRPVFETTARVAWCRGLDRGYELGVAFLDPDEAFRTRMVEQVCHIEQYRKSTRNLEGRELSAGDAAVEWIGKYAAGFPGAGA